MAKGSVFVVGKYVNQYQDPTASRQAHGYLDYLMTTSEAVPEGGELTAFDHLGLDRTCDEAHAVVEGWEHKYFNFVEDLSPHPGLHRVQNWDAHDWKVWASLALGGLQERHPDLEYLAVHHADAKHPHVQLILATQTTLRRGELGEVRAAADAAARTIDRERAELEADPVLEDQMERTPPQPTQPARQMGLHTAGSTPEADPDF